MAGTLPPLACCTPDCESPVTVEVPGPPGDDGIDGGAGPAGPSAFTTFTAAFTMPAELGSSVATVADTSWMGVNQVLYAAKTDGSVVGYLQVTAIGGATSVTLKNLKDTATGMYPGNSAPAAIFTIGSRLQPGGVQGPGGTTSGAAGGDLKGTYPNPKILVANAKGSIPVGNGTDTVAVPAGTNGHMLAYDSTDAEGVKSFKALPLTGDTDLIDNCLLRADGTTGLPVPAQPSKIVVEDSGAIRASGSGGNARGTNAVDLQVVRAGATQVASGTRSAIVGGENNTASSTESFVGGGDSNVASTGDRSAVVGGSSNTASNTEAFVGGGQNNVASGVQSTVAGGDGNNATATEATIAGGAGNAASATQASVGGGLANIASAANTTIGGGGSNTASNTYATVGGGANNAASGIVSVIPGGYGAVATNYGQHAHASGFFVSVGEAQTSEYTARHQTPNATPLDLLLDTASGARLVIPTGHSWMFQIMLVARKDDGLTSIYKSEGVITNVAGTVTMPAVATTTEIFDGIGLPATPVVVSADDPNNALIINVTGLAATNIRWCALIKTIEVKY